MGLSNRRFSQGVLEKIVEAGVNRGSYRDAAACLRVQAELPGIGAKDVERVVHDVGNERVAERDREVERFRALPLEEKCKSPLPHPPDLAVVQVDGGRLQIRPEPKGGAKPTEPPTKADEPDASDPDQIVERRSWREDKVAVLMTMKSDTFETDPCPSVPEAFTDREYAAKLAREVGKAHCLKGEESEAQDEGSQEQPDEPKKQDWQPKVLVRTVAATRQKAEEFGEMTKAAAYARGFAKANRKAFVADGAAMNWKLHRKRFSDYTPVLDFIHAMTYVYAAATAGRAAAEGFAVYLEWIRLVWQGRVERVLSLMAARLAELGQTPLEAPDAHPTRVVDKSLGYLTTHRSRMRYDEYRKQGLPLTSAYVESIIKQLNLRVKGTEKFWSGQGAEAILQLKADELSETGPLESFWERKQATQTSFAVAA